MCADEACLSAIRWIKILMRNSTMNQSLRSVLGKARWACGFVLVFAASSGVAHAFGEGPEIDPGSAAGALTLLSCGVLMITSRRRRS